MASHRHATRSDFALTLPSSIFFRNRAATRVRASRTILLNESSLYSHRTPASTGITPNSGFSFWSTSGLCRQRRRILHRPEKPAESRFAPEAEAGVRRNARAGGRAVRVQRGLVPQDGSRRPHPSRRPVPEENG